jgi:flagellin-like protein
MMSRSRSGISPVVATVILVAIAIVIAIAVAFWATGLVGVFTRFEKLEITSIYFDSNSVVLIVRNTGSADATIDNIFVNGRPCVVGDADNCGINPELPKTIDVGTSLQLTVNYPPTAITEGKWQGGVTYEVAVHTASGKTYPAAVLIP